MNHAPNRRSAMNRAVFLDRDGVINRAAAAGEYITRWEDFQFLPGVAQAISSLMKAGWKVMVVSNQRCVSKGILTIAELENIHRNMEKELAEAGAKLDGIYYCPHAKEPPCECRKPSPGMLLRAAREHQIDLASSWMVGDSKTDMEAGKRAGCRTMLIEGKLSASEAESESAASSLADAASRILILTAS